MLASPAAATSLYDTFLLGPLGALKSWTTVPRIEKSFVRCVVRDSAFSCGIAWDVLLRAKSDIGFNKFSLALPDRGWIGSYIGAGFEAEGGGVGSLAPVGRRPVCTGLFDRSAAVTNGIAFSEGCCGGCLVDTS